MRLILPLIALFLTTGAAAPQPVPPAPSSGQLNAQTDPQAVCNDRIHQVRQQRGLPQLERDATALEEPLLIAAVDRRLDGCSVLVMRSNTADIRPLPEPREHRWMRAR